MNEYLLLFLVMMGVAHTIYWIIMSIIYLYDYTIKKIAYHMKEKTIEDERIKQVNLDKTYEE